MSPTALAPAPSRATTNLTVSFGLVNIPLSVYTGTEETRVKRSEFFQGDPNVPVGRAAIRKDNGEVIEATDVTRMAQAEKGAWVTLTDDEIAACTSPRGLAEIVSFVNVKDAGQYLIEGVKQVRPKAEKGKSNAAVERAYVLFTTMLAKRKLMALVKVAMRGPARYALLDNKGNLFLIYTADAVRQWMDITVMPSPLITDQERNVANMLIDAVGVDAPTLVDTTAPVVQAYVNDKAKGIEPPTTPTAEATPVDLMEQLLASLEAAKKGQVA
jgi:DNA end-binding protein Ku